MKELKEKNKSEEVVECEVSEVHEEYEAVKEPITIFGKVNCKLLNVRKEPSFESEVVGVIKLDSLGLINFNESTDDFYKISFDNLEGYCAREYIDV
jgi:hypothetical protein